MATYKNPQQGKKEESERLEGEGEKIKFMQDSGKQGGISIIELFWLMSQWLGHLITREWSVVRRKPLDQRS